MQRPGLDADLLAAASSAAASRSPTSAAGPKWARDLGTPRSTLPRHASDDRTASRTRRRQSKVRERPEYEAASQHVAARYLQSPRRRQQAQGPLPTPRFSTMTPPLLSPSLQSPGSTASLATNGSDVRSVDELLTNWRARRANRVRKRGSPRGIPSVEGLASPLGLGFAMENVHAAMNLGEGMWVSPRRSRGRANDGWAAQGQVTRRWSRAMRLSELEQMRARESSQVLAKWADEEPLVAEEFFEEDSAAVGHLRWAFARWHRFMREDQFEEIKELSAIFHHEVTQSQKAFSAWKLAVMDRQWQRATEHQEMRILRKAWKAWASFVARRAADQVCVVDAFAEHRRNVVLRRHLEAWRVLSSKRRAVRERGAQVFRDHCARAWLRRWREALGGARRQKLARVIMRGAWKVLVWRSNVFVACQRLPVLLEGLQRTADFRFQACKGALGRWRGFVKERRLAAFYGDLRNVLREMQARLASRQRRRWRRFFARSRLRRGMQQWHSWTARDRQYRACFEMVRKARRAAAARRVLEHWRCGARAKRCARLWSLLATGARDDARAMTEAVSRFEARRASRVQRATLRAWRLAARAERHHRVHILRQALAVLGWQCARRRVQMRLAAAHAESMRVESAFRRWRRVAATSVCWSRATALHNHRLQAKSLSMWKRFVHARALEAARERSLQRQHALGWFSEVRLEAARAYHRRKSLQSSFSAVGTSSGPRRVSSELRYDVSRGATRGGHVWIG